MRSNPRNFYLHGYWGERLDDDSITLRKIISTGPQYRLGSFDLDIYMRNGRGTQVVLTLRGRAYRDGRLELKGFDDKGKKVMDLSSYRESAPVKGVVGK